MVANILGGVTLSNPSAVVVDRIGNVVIADTSNDRIAEIDTASNGTVLYTDSQTLNGPLGVALDPFGTAYIADTGGNRGLVVDPPVNGDLGPGRRDLFAEQIGGRVWPCSVGPQPMLSHLHCLLLPAEWALVQ